MRFQRTLTILLLVGFLAVAMGTALAQNDSSSREAQAQERREAAKARYEALVAARHAAIDSFRENRSAIIDTYRADLNVTRDTFLADKAGVIEGCRAEHADMSNATSEERDAYAKCVRDGVKPLIEKARADNAASREKARASLLELRTEKIGEFRQARDNADARYGRPTRGA